MAEIRRINKDRKDPWMNGEKDVFFIPRDLLPENLSSGKEYKVIIEGVYNEDEQGGVVNAERVYFDEPDKKEEVKDREDDVQKKAEGFLQVEIGLKKQ
jgi:hypothetical protein